MAIVHISKSEAARDPEGTFARAWGGDEVVIEYGDGTLALTRQMKSSRSSADVGPPRNAFDLLDEKIARNGNDRAYVDSGEFAKDLLAAATAPRLPEDETKRKARVEEFINFMKQCGNETQANGLTEETLKRLLREDAD